MIMRNNNKKKQEKKKFKFKSTERFLKPDNRFNDIVVAKFINNLMRSGKKSVAERIFYDCLEILGKRIKDDEPIQAFHKALNNIKPEVEVRSRRVGGTTYQVPIPIDPKRQQALAIRQVLQVTRGKKGKPMAERLADEFVAAYNKEGASIQWRENTHKMAEANKLFAHFAFR